MKFGKKCLDLGKFEKIWAKSKSCIPKSIRSPIRLWVNGWILKLSRSLSSIRFYATKRMHYFMKCNRHLNFRSFKYAYSTQTWYRDVTCWVATLFRAKYIRRSREIASHSSFNLGKFLACRIASVTNCFL